MNAQQRYEKWLHWAALQEEERQSLLAIQEDSLAITKAFGATLTFGTAGLRGIMGMGTNRMNRFTVAWATAGIAEWLLETGKAGSTIVISSDSRLNHRLFTETTALVLHQFGFKVLFWQIPAPTPVLSWSVRHFDAAAGIMITASHNPRNYNGYKAYDANGCQLLSPDANCVTAHADAYFNGKSLEITGDFESLVEKGDIVLLEDALDIYLDTVYETLTPFVEKNHTPLRIGFTPLHGVGGAPVKKVLERAGFEVIPVASQFEPDGNFPTIETPNPELPVAFDALYQLADKTPCDLLLATDPDGDRIGIAVPTATGYQLLNGNQIGSLLIDFISQHRPVQAGDTIITTTVTSAFGKEVARYWGYELIETFTGFKYIGNCINDICATNGKTFVFGYEESHGYLFGTHARDKDAIVTSLLVAFMAQHAKAQGHLLSDVLTALYDKVGAYTDRLVNLTFDPVPGQEPISDQIMAKLRQHPPTSLADVPITKIVDYLQGIGTLPKENVLQYVLNNGSVVSFRPSGTEPKMKCYINARHQTLSASQALAERLEQWFHRFVAQLKEEASL